MSLINQFDNRVGITYVYEVDDILDEATGKTRQKRKLIGKLDPDTGDLVPTGKRGRPSKAESGKSRNEAPDREYQEKARLLDTIRQKDEAIDVMTIENAKLKADIARLEKTIRSIMTLCQNMTFSNR